MNTTTPLSQRLENLSDIDFVEALKSEFVKESQRRSHNAVWKARIAGYPVRLYLDKLYMDASVNGSRPCRQSAFVVGLQVAFGAIAELAKQQAAKGDPALKDALQRLDRRCFQADVPELRRETMSNLLGWSTKYPAFLIAFQISIFYHGRAREQLVAWLSLYDGLFAMTSWVVMAVSRQDREQGQPV